MGNLVVPNVKRSLNGIIPPHTPGAGSLVLSLLGPELFNTETSPAQNEIHESVSLDGVALYNPNYLDDPTLRTGKHKTVISLPCMMVRLNAPFSNFML
jgi:hypothetical protein